MSLLLTTHADVFPVRQNVVFTVLRLTPALNHAEARINAGMMPCSEDSPPFSPYHWKTLPEYRKAFQMPLPALISLVLNIDTSVRYAKLTIMDLKL